MKVIFFGTPEFSAKMLSFLLANGVDVVAVVSRPDKPQGRSKGLVATPVKEIATSHKLPLFQPERVSSEDFAPTLAAFNADLFVVVAFGEIIRQHLLDMPRYGCINTHTSLLPKYRGAAPIQRAIMSGETESGVTIMQMVRKMDAGDMIKVAKVPIPPEMTFGELENSLFEAGSKALLEVIHEYQTGTPPKHYPQDESLVTLAPKIELEECEINWQLPAQQIHNLVRGVNPEPGAWCYVTVKGESKRLKIKTTHITDQAGSPGEILSYGKGPLLIACGQGALEIATLQLEGKKAMSSTDFMRGLPKEEFRLDGALGARP